MSMTRHDYDLIAMAFERELHGWRESAGPVYGQEAITALRAAAEEIAETLEANNSNFDRAVFLKKAGVTE